MFWNLDGNSWGWDPSSIAAAGTAGGAILAAVAAYFAFRSWQQMRIQTEALKTQTSALDNEIRDRMRPWVGVHDLEFRRDPKDSPILFILFKNLGPLPAQNSDLVVDIEPRVLNHNERPNPIHNTRDEEKVLVPAEEGNYNIQLGEYAQLEKWIADKRDLKIEGTFTYALAERKFESKFAAELWFSRSEVPEGKLVHTNWRNTSAT